VVPQGQSFRTTNSCTGTLARRATSAETRDTFEHEKGVKLGPIGDRLTAYDKASGSVSGITLIIIGLQHCAAIKFRLMISFVLGCVVRVDRVRNVGRDQEGLAEGNGFQLIVL
jgi:hypothetical protein